jgi:hypothetical protein
MTPLTNAGCFFLVLVDKVVAQVNFLESSQDKDVFMEVEDKEEDAAEDNKDNQRAAQLRAELDDRMSSNDHSRVFWHNAPAGTSHMVDHMLGKFQHRKPRGGADAPKMATYIEKVSKQRGGGMLFFWRDHVHISK